MIVLVITGTLLLTFFIGAVLHEVAHALAADVVGLGVREVQIGSGPLLCRTGLGRRLVELRLLPGQGMVQYRHQPKSWRRSRRFVFVAAGPVCDLVLLITLMAASRQPYATDYVDVALLVAVCAQAYRLLANLWPHMVAVDDTRVASDGLQLLHILRGREAAGSEQPEPYASHHRLYEVLVTQYLLPGQSLPLPSERSADVLDYLHAAYVLRVRIGPEVISRLESMVSSSEVPAIEQLMLLNALITATLPQGDPERLADLDRWSARAFEQGTEVPTVRASRGSVLVEIGRAAEGLALLEDCLNGQDFNDCLVHAYRALGRFKLGDVESARSEFAAAKALFRHEQWHGEDIARIVERIGKAIGSELKLPTTWSVEAARAAFRTRTSTRSARPDIP